ncbi:hypothetical protein NX774_19975 [Massilia agilis]|uniref:Uncharacterized protein n=1 Tax=Massilia agilis TaxID=1811226 RepID=A0ABT2DG82_9BURK|nr:hypothetical protein [Massilia agilis]MCS0810206.1 hypothetical protein [Massilia agilis]
MSVETNPECALDERKILAKIAEAEGRLRAEIVQAETRLSSQITAADCQCRIEIAEATSRLIMRGGLALILLEQAVLYLLKV